MEIFLSKELGFCSGVTNAINLAIKNSEGGIFSYGQLIHNDSVLKDLKKRGINTIEDLNDAKDKKVLIRAHGVTPSQMHLANSLASEVIDATCPFVKESQRIVKEHFDNGYQIIILGNKNHPEIIGLNGYCNNTAIIIDSINFELPKLDKVCVIAQTTFNKDLYNSIVSRIKNLNIKTFACFNTICYTTKYRQSEASRLSKICEIMLVIGDKKSANTTRLFELSNRRSKAYFIEKPQDLNVIHFLSNSKVGIVAGASTPIALIKEVLQSMSDNELNANVVEENEFTKAIESMKNDSLRVGKRVECTIVAISNEGLLVDIGQKREGLVPVEEINLDGSFNADDFKVGETFFARVISTQKGYKLSRKAILENEKGNEEVQKLQDSGEEFSIQVEKAVKGGVIGHFNGYTVFVPASQIRLTYVKNLEQYVGKNLRLRVLENGVDNAKKRILASQKVILEAEKKQRDDAFREYITTNDVIEGKVVRFTDFGAFVNVMGVDCLAHVSDLSWGAPKKPEEILEIGKRYNFKVLKTDFVKNRHSLGYKQLQKHPWELAAEKYPVGTVITSKVVRVVPFGAFVEIEPGLDGLVHVSNISHSFLKDINQAIKVGDEIKAKVIEVVPAEKKLTLSIKALLPEPEKKPRKEAQEVQAEGEEKSEKPKRRTRAKKAENKVETEKKPRERKAKKPAEDIDTSEYISSTSEASIADMIANLKLDDDEK